MRKKTLQILKRIDQLVGDLERADDLKTLGGLRSQLRVGFDTLRIAVVNMNSDSWREHYDWMKDISKGPEDLAEMMGVSLRTLRNREREMGLAPRRPGVKKRVPK